MTTRIAARPAAPNRDGMPVGEAFAHLAGTGHHIEAELPDPSAVDAVFLALPHGQAATIAPPVLAREALTRPRLIASPGCYPTAALLAIAPLARAGLVHDVVVDAKSGVSGAGREPKLETHFGEGNESVRAYGLGGHRPP